MTALRRIAPVAGSAVVVVSLMSTSAVAMDLNEVLERANGATYSAGRLVVSVWGGQTEISKSYIEHANGSEMVRVDSVWSIVGNGRAVTMGETPSGVAFMSHADPISTDRYSIGETSPARHMRRECTVVPVMEGDILRATLVVDNNTGVPLITEMLTESGTVFRRTSLQDFKAYRTYAGPHDDGSATYEVVMPRDSDFLPQSVAGYQLVEVFPAPADAAQGFYSDGLFTFSLFVFPPGTPVTGFENPIPFVTASGTYDSIASADDVSVQWTTPDHEYVLVGNLPPDHAADVLAELPGPDARSTFARWWHRLFG